MTIGRALVGPEPYRLEVATAWLPARAYRAEAELRARVAETVPG